MHPRIILFAAASVAFDLLCVAGAAAVLLTNNLWLADVGVARFWLVVALAGGALIPVLYLRELDDVAKRMGRSPERKASNLPAWAGVERSVHAS